MSEQDYGFETLAIHAGAAPDPTTGARATPIYQTTSFVFDDVDHAAALFNLQRFGNIYSRITNPTVSVLEERIAALEGGTAACAVASGHAAQFIALLNLMQRGDELISSTKLYGGSITQFGETFPKFGWRVRFVDPTRPAEFKKALRKRTKAISSRAPPTRTAWSATSRRSPGSRTRWAFPWSSTTPCRRRTCASRSGTAPMSWCTR